MSQSLDMLRGAWESAAEVDIQTAEALRHGDRNIYRLGKLLLTSVYLKDVGLVGYVELETSYIFPLARAT